MYYEVLDIPLPELQGLKTLKVAYHSAIKDEVWVQLVFVSRSFLILDSFFQALLLLNMQVVIHNIRLPKQSTVGDVIIELKTKVGACFMLC